MGRGGDKGHSEAGQSSRHYPPCPVAVPLLAWDWTEESTTTTAAIAITTTKTSRERRLLLSTYSLSQPRRYTPGTSDVAGK